MKLSPLCPSIMAAVSEDVKIFLLCGIIEAGFWGKTITNEVLAYSLTLIFKGVAATIAASITQCVSRMTIVFALLTQ